MIIVLTFEEIYHRRARGIVEKTQKNLFKMNQTNYSLQWTVASHVDGTKGYIMWHTKVSDDTRTDEEVMKRQERRSKGFAVSDMVLLFCFGLMSFFLFFLSLSLFLPLFACLHTLFRFGGCNRDAGEYGGQEENRIVCMMWNLQRFNTKCLYVCAYVFIHNIYILMYIINYLIKFLEKDVSFTDGTVLQKQKKGTNLEIF